MAKAEAKWVQNQAVGTLVWQDAIISTKRLKKNIEGSGQMAASFLFGR